MHILLIWYLENRGVRDREELTADFNNDAQTLHRSTALGLIWRARRNGGCRCCCCNMSSTPWARHKGDPCGCCCKCGGTDRWRSSASSAQALGRGWQGQSREERRPAAQGQWSPADTCARPGKTERELDQGSLARAEDAAQEQREATREGSRHLLHLGNSCAGRCRGACSCRRAGRREE
jgi:hypothetical protein